jgi:hypothetical protein
MSEIPDTQYLRLPLEKCLYFTEERFPRNDDPQLDLQVAAGKELLESIRRFDEVTRGGRRRDFQSRV